MSITFVYGGSRSGKSLFAEQYAAKQSQLTDTAVTYIATSDPVDDELNTRISLHRNRRPTNWSTVEEPCNVAAWLSAAVVEGQPRIILIDCLSMLINNWMFYEGDDTQTIRTRIEELTEVLKQSQNATAESTLDVIIVSSEVGQGIVPGDTTSRLYRDWLGLANQAVAALSQHVFAVMCGIPIDIRKWEASW